MVEKTLCTSAETEASSAITEAVSGVSAANHTAVDKLEKRHRPPQSIYRLIITVTLIDFIPMTLHCTALSTWKAFIKKEKKKSSFLEHYFSRRRRIWNRNVFGLFVATILRMWLWVSSVVWYTSAHQSCADTAKILTQLSLQELSQHIGDGYVSCLSPAQPPHLPETCSSSDDTEPRAGSPVQCGVTHMPVLAQHQITACSSPCVYPFPFQQAQKLIPNNLGCPWKTRKYDIDGRN